MHYYKKNLGDYYKKAGRLTILQHGAYTLLLDSCYDRERFPTLGEAIEWTWANTPEEKDAVEFVLRKFFVLEGEIYVQKRVQEELSAFKEKSEKNRRIALERESKRKQKSTKRARNVHETPPNQEPLTTNQKEKKEKKESWNLPKEVNPEIWAEFEQHRKDIRKPLTDQARTKNANILKLLPVDKQRQCVDTTIAQRWTGVFPPKAEPKPKRNGSGTAEDVGRAYEAEFGKPPPPGKTTDEVRAMISQKRERAAGWWDS